MNGVSWGTVAGAAVAVAVSGHLGRRAGVDFGARPQPAAETARPDARGDRPHEAAPAHPQEPRLRRQVQLVDLSAIAIRSSTAKSEWRYNFRGFLLSFWRSAATQLPHQAHRAKGRTGTGEGGRAVGNGEAAGGQRQDPRRDRGAAPQIRGAAKVCPQQEPAAARRHGAHPLTLETRFFPQQLGIPFATQTAAIVGLAVVLFLVART